MPQIERAVDIRAPLERVFAFLSDVRNHGRIAPPETREQLVDAGDIPLRLGTQVTFRACYGGRYWMLSSRIVTFDPPNPACPDRASFRDEQVRGPFAFWRHDHEFQAAPDGGTRLTDRFTYTVPFGLLGRLVDHLWLRGRLIRLMEHMQSAAKRLLEAEEAGR
jgi:ligand-binding SRPBCC domain-containing protein